MLPPTAQIHAPTVNEFLIETTRKLQQPIDAEFPFSFRVPHRILCSRGTYRDTTRTLAQVRARGFEQLCLSVGDLARRGGGRGEFSSGTLECFSLCTERGNASIYILCTCDDRCGQPYASFGKFKCLDIPNNPCPVMLIIHIIHYTGRSHHFGFCFALSQHTEPRHLLQIYICL